MGKNNKNLGRKKKVSVVFDEAKRKEFLCGFRKRKLERKKKAQEEMQRMLKEEKKRIKQENKEMYKKLVVSSRPIPDIEKLLQEEYEDDDVNVKIVEVSTDTLQKNDLVIGENKPKLTSENNKPIQKKVDAVIGSIPGMGSDAENDVEEESATEETDTNLKTKKEIKRLLKKQATKKIQKSKVYQMKSKLDRVKNKKKSLQKKGHNMKAKSELRKDKSKKKVARRKHK